MISAGGVSINKTKVESADLTLSGKDLLNDKYILIQKGKKNYFILKIK
jgi:tyrosyl-tRNA synthetase